MEIQITPNGKAKKKKKKKERGGGRTLMKTNRIKGLS